MKRIGIDVGATKTVIATLDEAGSLRAFHKVPSAQMLRVKDDAVNSLQFFIDEYMQNESIDRSSVMGVGIGVPAVLDSHSQEIVSCPNLPGLDQLPLSRLLAPKLGLPVVVENDVNLIALGEHAYGRGRGVDDLACIFVGSGLGCGLILRGQLYTGADGAAAEFGHTISEPDGRICGCGAQGCIEIYCSGRAFSIDAEELGFSRDEDSSQGEEKEDYGQWSLAEKLIRAANAGDEKPIQALKMAFYRLGLATTSLVNILNPRLIILGGGIVSGWPQGLDMVRDTVRKRARAVVRDRVEFDYPALGDQAGLYGAGRLVELETAKR